MEYLPLEQGLMSYHELEVLQRQLNKAINAEDSSGEVLEIGAWKGQSTLALAKYSKVITIDPFVEGTFNDFTRNVNASTYKENVELYKMTSDEYFSSHSPKLKFAFIDGSHVHPHPYKDIRNVWGRLNANGIMVVDDVNLPDVMKGIENNGLKDIMSVDWERMKLGILAKATH